VVEGNYLFTLKNLINKEFEIIPGGSIRWYGDPMAADLQLQTLYRLSSPLNDILADNSGAYNQRVPVHLIMNLYGDMMNPEISFDIDLPTADQITRGRVESAISSEQELNRQAFALLVMRKFVAPPHVAGNGSGGAVAVDNTMEMLSAQVSRWLQDISDVFDIGFNYRPGDEISNDEISLALSTQLFSDKLSVSGNFGVSQGSETNQNPNSIIGDLKMEYKVTEDGKVRLIVYNQSNDFEVANTAQAAYTQGMGILYREEFNTMAEFYCAFHNLLRKKEDREVCVFE
jgi:hypothetical protein